MDWKDLGPIIGASAPVLGKIVGGLLPFPGGGLIGEMAGKLVASQFGVPPEPEAVQEAIRNAPPDIAIERLKAAQSEAEAKWPALAEMAKAQHEAETEQFKTQIADVANARQQTAALVELSSAIAWGAPLISILVVLGYFGILILYMLRGSSAPESQVIVLLIGSLATAFGSVIAYWLGSTASSRAKDATMATMATSADQNTARAVERTAITVGKATANAAAAARR